MTRLAGTRRAWPSLVSASRIAAAPVLHLLITAGRFRAAAVLLGGAAVTDLLDGMLARRLDAVTRAGAWVDVSADFVLIAAGLTGLVAAGAAPAWVPILAALMFAQFIASSRRGLPTYDPIGRYYGGFLYGVVAVILLAPDVAVWHAASIAVAAMTVASFGSRVARYWRTTTSASASSVSPTDVTIPRTR
jgi:CDP-diacylglycerol--glycerol-3-phosphate 3-phosphatidyltransferase/cardiolipin synthase